MEPMHSWGPPNPDQLGWTLDRHILERQRKTPGATGDFTGLFQSIALAGRMIASRVHKAGLSDVLGRASVGKNVQGEVVQKLDVLANQILVRCVEAGGHVCVMASEENEDIIPIPPEFPKGKYVLMFDPLDGSSNIDVCMSIGTIFSIHRRVTAGSGPGTAADCMQKGTEQVAAGYILYGSSTMLVYTTGDGVHGFTVGQRKGLGIDRPAADGRPRYVLGIEPVSGTVRVGPEAALDVTAITARTPVWTSGAAPDAPFGCVVQVRAHGGTAPATVTPLDSAVQVELSEPLRGVAPGQAVAFYRPDDDGDVVLGSATITGTA